MKHAASSADQVWILVSSGLVMIMLPGLALFYGGMVRAKNVLSVMMNVLVALAVVSVIWVLGGFSLAFGDDVGGGLIGNLHLFGLHHLDKPLPGLAALSVTPSAFMLFQLMFAAITAALLAGAVADRMRFGAFVAVIVLWTLLVYIPVAHWVFSPTGWLAGHGVLDFAGGTVVEVNSGFSALALAIAVGRRKGWPHEAMAPHSVPLTLVGAGILWFGWFGFNAGSALSVGNVATTAFINTQLAASTGLIGWLLVDRYPRGRATTLGAASGAVAGMVAITPCAGFLDPVAALAVGLVAGLVCANAVKLKFKLGYDDTLDVLGVHGVGGLIGMLGLGLLATTSVNAAGRNGLLTGGSWSFLGWELAAAAITAAFAFTVTFGIAKVVDLTFGLRVDPEAEFNGLDLSEHAESAYSAGSSGRISS